MQKVLVMLTKECNVRSKAGAWDGDDADLVVKDKQIGFTPTIQESICFDCPLRAMAAGWKLLAPPIRETPDLTYYMWWLVKE